MDMSASPSWFHDDSMAQLNASLDDLGNLFDFGDIDLNNLSSVDDLQFDDQVQHALHHPATPFDHPNEGQALARTATHDFGAQQQYGTARALERRDQAPPPTTQGQLANNPYAPDHAFNHQLHQDFHATQQAPYQHSHAFLPHQQIPPTPNSYEMHGESGRCMQGQMDSQQRGAVEQAYQLRKESMTAFTPTVSPAGTPQYNAQSQYTIPGAYFSPLTSPMLHAHNTRQGHPQHRTQGFYTNPSTAPSSNATSPMDLNGDVEMLADEVALTESPDSRTSKTPRRKPQATRSTGPLARVKESPIQKAMKRKSGSMLSSVGGLSDSQKLKSAQPTATGLQIPPIDSSENGSISPEPLCEALMGPPPRPSSSKNNSPAIRAQQHQDSTAQARALGAAATPKSLLSMTRGRDSGAPSSGQSCSQDSGDTDMEDLQLPAAVADNSTRPPSLTKITTDLPSSIWDQGEKTPRLAARKTPKLGPASTPSSTKAPSTAPSPLLAGSPMVPSAPSSLLRERKDTKLGKTGRKRGSVSNIGSSMPSPALRPRISPVIKPLLPEGASLHSPTHAFLLASKSNYQNLLEGNQLPGVSYPESLSTGLTSKRTSHKVAEQGRRNRINEALKEMQALLPKIPGTAGKDADGSPPEDASDPPADGKESKEDAAAKSSSSKAATVESANDYIRKLQKENAALLALKRENEELRSKLEAVQGSVTASSQGSPETNEDAMMVSTPVATGAEAEAEASGA